MTARRLAILSAGLMLAACGGSAPAGPADLVLYNGKIFTASDAKPWAQAILIRGDRIFLVGTTAEVRSSASKGARSIDLEGRVVVPGFNDAHDHVSAAQPGMVVPTVTDPLPEPSFALVADSLAAAVARTPAGTRLEVMVGERVLSDPKARRNALDRIAPKHPVALVAWTGHGRILNSLALAAEGLTDSVVDPLGGRFDRDHGRLTGLIEEYASYGMMAPRGVSDSAVTAAFRARADSAVSLGITSIQDMTTSLTPEQVGRLAGRSTCRSGSG